MGSAGLSQVLAAINQAAAVSLIELGYEPQNGPKGHIGFLINLLSRDEIGPHPFAYNAKRGDPAGLNCHANLRGLTIIQNFDYFIRLLI
jgi:hypothetical protein